MAKGFKHGSSGGSELNFRVLGGTEQPANPKENTIWVSTDTDISGWVFSPAEPESPAEGMVWIVIGSASDPAFNAVKKNTVIISPGACKQYTLGSWKSRMAYIYAGGWKQFGYDAVFLYNKADPCTDLTGGWSARGWKGSSTNQSVAPSITTNTSSVRVNVSGVDYGAGVYEALQAIDLTQYNTLKIKILGKAVSQYASMNQYFGLCVLNNRTDTYPTRIAGLLIKDCEIGENTLDISKITGEKAIAICTMSDSDMTQYVEFDGIWLE